MSTFVPKPHTPFQWVPCDSPDQIDAKQRLLRNALTGPGLKYSWTNPKDTLLEAWLSRGDRRLSEVIYSAWQHGAKFDAWQDQYRYDPGKPPSPSWVSIPTFYTHRTRFMDEIFPWEHIDPACARNS